MITMKAMSLNVNRYQPLVIKDISVPLFFYTYMHILACGFLKLHRCII